MGSTELMMGMHHRLPLYTANLLLLLSFGAVANAQQDHYGQNVLAEFPLVAPEEPVVVPTLLGPDQYDFVLDTGADTTCFDLVLRGRLGKSVGEIAVRTSTGERLLNLFGIPPAWSIPAINTKPLRVMCCDLHDLREASGVDFFGVLGMDVLRGHVLRVDFERRKLTFYRALPARSGTAVPLRWTKSGAPLVDVSFGGAFESLALVDIGSIGLPGINIEHGLFQRLAESGHLSEMTNLDIGARGVAGTLPTRYAQLDRAAVGAFEHQGVGVTESHLSVVGLGLLSRYIVTFDFPNATMYLRKGRHFDEPEKYDLSGLDVSRRDGLLVRGVQQRSVAAALGILEGDRIVAVNGEQTEHLRLSHLRALLASPGRVELEIERAGTRKRVTLQLDNKRISRRERPPTEGKAK